MSNLTSIVPQMIDALISSATTALPDVTVTDGVITGMPEGDYLFIGVDDPDVTRWQSATSDQSWAVATYTSRDETGSITCAAHSWTGSAGPKAARDAAYNTAGAIQNLLRDKTSFNVPGLLFANYARGSLTQMQDDFGAMALLIFQIDFKARI